MPQQPYVCAGGEVTCLCTAPSNETIFWCDNNTLPSFSSTQVCNSCGSFTPSTVHIEVMNCPSCSSNFTSRLSYKASHRMGSSNTIIQIDCFIVPESQLPSCSPTTVPSHLEQNSSFTEWCVTNCTGMCGKNSYMTIKTKVQTGKKANL